MQTGYSQERFGFAVGLHRTYMGHLERGTANPTVKTLHVVAQGLGISVTDLFRLAATAEAEWTSSGSSGATEAAQNRAPRRGALASRRSTGSPSAKPKKRTRRP